MTLNRKKIITIAAATLATLLLLSATLLPFVVRSKAVNAIREETGRNVRIEALYINPLTLTVTVKGFALSARDGGPFVAFDRLKASLSPASLFRRAPILSRITLDKPVVSFQRLAANSYSFSDIIQRQQAKPKKPAGPAPLFSLNNITLHAGSIDFEDRAVTGGRMHTVRNLEIALPFISNMPYLIDTYTDPKITAQVNGAPFSFQGKVKPLSKSLETSVRIDLKRLDIPHYLAYAPVAPPVALSSGKLTVDTEVTYRISRDRKPELHLSGLVAVEEIAAAHINGKPLAKLASLTLRPAQLDLFARRFSFTTIGLDGLELFIDRNSRGEWLHGLAKRLRPRGAEQPQQTEAVSKDKGAGPAPQVKFERFQLANGAVHFRDDLPAGGFSADAGSINLSLERFDSLADAPAAANLSLTLDNDTSFSLKGDIRPAPRAVAGRLALRDLRLKKGWPYLAAYLTAAPTGSADLELALAYTPQEGAVVSDGAFTLRDFAVRYGDKEGFDLARLEVKGAGYSQQGNRVEVADVLLSRSSLRLSRASDGTLSPLTLLKRPAATAPARTESRAAATAKAAKTSAPPLSYQVRNLRLERFDAAFVDKQQEEQPHFTLKNTTLNLKNISGPRWRPIRMAFSTTLNKATPVKAQGDLTPLPFRYKGNLSVGRLPLQDFENYMPDNLNLYVIGGTFDTAMDLDVSLKDGKPAGTFRGSAGVRAFHCVDADAEEDLLKWESLQLDEVQGGLAPVSLSIRQVALNNVYSRIVVRKDGTLNLQNLVEKPEPGPSAAGPNITAAPPAPATPALSTPPAPAAAPQPAPARPAITIGAVTIQDGTLAFTDRHLPQNFNSTFYNLGGRVTGLSSEESILADVDLRGNLENHSPLQITGKINPLKQDLYVDLKIAFKDIDLSPVTPYSGTYLGYTVDKGKLFLDLKYLIDKKQLNSENRVFIDQFTFGRAVESDKATKLPVRLAVALLKDRQGEIHLDLPVTGRTDDPKFSIWGVVWQVFRNLIVKAATSPFGLLSSMFGNGQDFSSVPFGVGSSKLAAAEEQKLLALAKVLADRPGLKIEIKGYVDREKDAEGYRRELLERKLRNEKFLTMARERQTREGQTAETTVIQPEELTRYLTQVYRKEKFPKPRNALGMVKDLPDAEMRKLIIANTVVGENEFQELARERAAAVRDFMVSRGNLPAERLFQKNDDIYRQPEKSPATRSRVEFAAFAQ